MALRAVAPGEKPAVKEKPLTVKQAAESGIPRHLLVALRARIAADIDDPNTHPRDVATLSSRLLEIAREVHAIDSRSGGDEVGNAASTPDEEWATS